ncbi:MAG TPA: RsiV family protein [Gammaproteobacteria bacterium]|nr:RsiV family protein [Gammaproteobacteria bacterium]
MIIETKYMHHLLKILCIIIFTLSLSSHAFADDGDDDDDGKDNEQQTYQITDSIDLVPTVNFQYAKPKIVIKSTYPRLVGEETDDHIDEFNTLVQAILKEEIASFKDRVIQAQMVQQKAALAKLKNELVIDFATSILNTTKSPIISVRFSIQGYITPQAHPYHYHRVLNYDLASGLPIELAELFKPDANYLAVLADYSRKILDKKLEDKQFILAGTAPTSENYKNWNLKPSGLLITFDEYQVAPYVYGTQTVLIPYAVLNDLFATDSPLGLCLKNKRKCLRNNVLTGGFMDELVS